MSSTVQHCKSGGSTTCSQNGCGTVFALTPTAHGPWTETVVHRFTGGKDGGLPIGGVVFDALGNLYGTAESGGNASGVVFEMSVTAGKWKEKVLYAFNNTGDGAGPRGTLIFDAAGNLYGTTYQ